MKKLLITLIITMAVCVSAQATVQYSADFEAPAYSIGPVNGQNGWIGSDPTVQVIADGSAPSGSQVLKVATQDAVTHNAYAYPNANQDLVKLSVWFNGPEYRASNPGIFLRNGSTYFVWGELVAGSLLGNYNLYGNEGNQYAAKDGVRYRWTAGEWNQLAFWLDFANQQFAAEINGELVTEWDMGGTFVNKVWTPFDNPVSKLDTIQFFGRVNTNGTPFLIDDLIVEQDLAFIPEPASMMLLGLGLLIARKKRS